MSKDLISVVIPSYNHERFVVQALTSVMSQDYRPLELIVIDDGSSDGSVDAIRSLIPRIEKARVDVRFTARENRGAHNTINEALSSANGDWLTILNSDDYYLPKRLTKLHSLARKKKSEMLFSQVKHVDDDDRPLPDQHPFRSWYVDNWKRRYPTLGFRLLDENVSISTGNLFFSRGLFEATGSFRDYVLIHDYDFILRSLAFTEPVCLEEELLAYRVHRKNTISNLAHLNAEEGPRVAFDFMMQTLVHPLPRNKVAPWARSQSKNFRSFWTSKRTGAIRSWLGTDDLSALYDNE